MGISSLSDIQIPFKYIQLNILFTIQNELICNVDANITELKKPFGIELLLQIIF